MLFNEIYGTYYNAVARVLGLAVRGDKCKYRVTVYYDSCDETEMIIRVLSFGPFLKVTAPARFVGLIKQRLQRQKEFCR